jgi:hypothetical protein
METIDYKKQYKALYNASAQKMEIIDVPGMNFLMIDGAGDPNTVEPFRQGIEALYSVSYTVKFMVKKGPSGTQYTVMPLEGLWWMDDMTGFDMDRKDDWKWTLMIMQPDFITEELISEAISAVGKKKELPALVQIRFERFHEGKCAQVLHIGSYADEPATIERLHEFVWNRGFKLRGKHHEVYLSDPRRTAPEKLKTIVRQPVE